jgi:hypothetical protein
MSCANVAANGGVPEFGVQVTHRLEDLWRPHSTPAEEPKLPISTVTSEGHTPDGQQRIITTGDPASAAWLSRPDVRTVLAVTPHRQGLNRILDCLPAIEADYRVQVVFTVPETGYGWAGMEGRLRQLGVLVMPWRQVIDTPFDLILSPCRWGISEVGSSPLMLMSHGATSIRSRIAHETAEHDLTPAKLMRGEEVQPTRLMLATDDEVRTLARSCPDALPTAVVAGIRASTGWRRAHRSPTAT